MLTTNPAEAVKALQGYQMIEARNNSSALFWGVDPKAYHWDMLLHEERNV